MKSPTTQWWLALMEDLAASPKGVSNQQGDGLGVHMGVYAQSLLRPTRCGGSTRIGDCEAKRGRTLQPTFQFVDFKSGRRDSNPRRPAWEAGILPLNYSRLIRFEI